MAPRRRGDHGHEGKSRRGLTSNTRIYCRAKARKVVRGIDLRQQLKSRGIVVYAGSMGGLAEEAPAAYKDVSRVVEVVHKAGIAKKIARLEPVAVIKG